MNNVHVDVTVLDGTTSDTRLLLLFIRSSFLLTPVSSEYVFEVVPRPLLVYVPAVHQVTSPACCLALMLDDGGTSVCKQMGTRMKIFATRYLTLALFSCQPTDECRRNGGNEIRTNEKAGRQERYTTLAYSL